MLHLKPIFLGNLPIFRQNNPHIHALGDCITVDGQASRYIEPIGRQALTIAG